MKAILICPTNDLREQFEKAAAQFSFLTLIKSLGEYPEDEALRRLIRVWSPEALFISMEASIPVQILCRQMAAEFPWIQLIGLSPKERPAILREALHLRMTELLTAPFEEPHFSAGLDRIVHQSEMQPAAPPREIKLFAFLPAKAGSGTSTLAANFAWALSEQPNQNVLLADADFSSGTTGFFFNTEHAFGFRDAAHNDHALDEESWTRLTKKHRKLDLLLSRAPIIDPEINGTQMMSVLDYACRAHSTVTVDLPEALDERSMVVMREATRIFLVTTPDLASLRLARAKAKGLEDLGWLDKTYLLVNRITKNMPLPLSDLEETVGLKAFSTFPCHYAEVTQATRQVRPSRTLAPGIQQMIERLIEKQSAAPKRRHKFIEQFAGASGRFIFG